MSEPERTRPVAQWHAKAAVVAVADALLVAGSYGMALLLRFDLQFSQVPREYLDGYALCVLPLVASALLCMAWRGLYRSIWAFVSVDELVRACEAWALEAALIATAALTVAPRMPMTFWVGGTALAFSTTCAIRFSWRAWRLVRTRRSRGADETRVMVVGAGEAGRALIREMRVTPSLGMTPVCAIDDNPAKRGRLIEGVPVVGGREDIAGAAERHRVGLVVVAVPSATGAQRKALVDAASATGLEVRVVPGMAQLVDGRVSVSRLREVRLEDLLGRDPVVVGGPEVSSLLRGRRVLVTGGGGSIGSEICRQVAAERPEELVIFDIYENNAYAIQQELLRTCPGLNLTVLIGSVRDERRVRAVFSEYRPQVVFHAAAHKHVPLMEGSPNEAVKNNVGGTLNCLRAALGAGAERFVLISTDKAVNPTNVMGATKRLCEMELQAVARRSAAEGARTTFSAVRFGNVLGSNGSVVPLFERQIAEGGPVTVTHPEITRYFMTIPEAVGLVLQAACYAQGGEIFVLDMGEPVKIADMAENLIRLAGYEPGVDIPIVYTGLRPGEKLYEERLMDEEGLRGTANSLISVARPIEMDDAAFAEGLVGLLEAAADDANDVRPLVAALAPTYHPELGGKE